MNTCKWCGGEIRDRSPTALYCCQLCTWRAAQATRNERKKLTTVPDVVCVCQICGGTFTTPGSRAAPADAPAPARRRKTCSVQCRTELNRRLAAARWAADKARQEAGVTTEYAANLVKQRGLLDGPCEEIECEQCRHCLASGACALFIATHFRPLTLEEVADEEGLTRERIRQIEKQALEKIARRAPRLAEYLEADIENWRRPEHMVRWRISDQPGISTPVQRGRRRVA